MICAHAYAKHFSSSKEEEKKKKIYVPLLLTLHWLSTRRDCQCEIKLVIYALYSAGINFRLTLFNIRIDNVYRNYIIVIILYYFRMCGYMRCPAPNKIIFTSGQSKQRSIYGNVVQILRQLFQNMFKKIDLVLSIFERDKTERYKEISGR